MSARGGGNRVRIIVSHWNTLPRFNLRYAKSEEVTEINVDSKYGFTKVRGDKVYYPCMVITH